MSSDSDPTEKSQPDALDVVHLTPVHSTRLAEVSELAKPLVVKDRMRLIAGLLESLPAKHRAAILEFGRQIVSAPAAKIRARVEKPRVEPLGPTLWDRLFDPAKTSDLYSAPRRFDLATIFVVTAAYSLLFGLMTPLDFGPAAKVIVGLLVTTVAASQALYHNKANPRGISVVTGAVTLTVLLVMVRIFVRNSIYGPLVVVVIFYGVIGGGIAGYLSGVLVGGVFLVADKLRKKFENPAKAESNDVLADDVE